MNVHDLFEQRIHKTVADLAKFIVSSNETAIKAFREAVKD